MAAPTPGRFTPPGGAGYSSDTMTVGDGTWDFSKNTFLLPNLQGISFETMRYNGMGSRFATLDQYHRIVLAHGVMAALVFVLLVPASVMTARFYAQQSGYAVVYHAQLQALAGLMLLAVFILGYFAVGPQRSLSNPHHGIGVAIFVLFILQLLGGRLVRNITKARSLRIMIHQWSGRAIALLGMIRVPLGLTLYGSPRYLFILYALWMAFLLLVYFVLSYRLALHREPFMSGAPSEGGRTRMTDSEYISTRTRSTHPRWERWLPLVAGAGLWAWKRDRDRDRARSRSPGHGRSPSYSRSRGPDALDSRRGSDSYSDRYTDIPPNRTGDVGQGGFIRALQDAASALGAGRLLLGLASRRQNRRDDEYSAVSTETPRRHGLRRGGTAVGEFDSDYTEDYRRDARNTTNTSLMPPSANPPVMASTRGPIKGGGPRRPITPRMRRGHDSMGGDPDDSEYSSYVSPSRRPVEASSGGGGFANAVLTALGVSWLTKRMAGRRERRREEQRLREEEEMRSGTMGSRYTGDGFPSPTRRRSRPPAFRRPTELRRGAAPSEITTSSMASPPAPGPGPGPTSDGHGGPGPQTRSAVEPTAMPPMPPDLSSDEDQRPRRRESSRRRRAGERASGRRWRRRLGPAVLPTSSTASATTESVVNRGRVGRWVSKSRCTTIGTGM